MFNFLEFILDFSSNELSIISFELPELPDCLSFCNFESIWFADHSHIPASYASNWPGGGQVPKWYLESMDQFIALGAAAVVTKKIKLATGICLVIQRDPIHLAREISTIDHLSNGRMIFGIGGGWNAEEMENHGTNFKSRFRRMHEQIAVIKAIWTQDEAEFHGEFYFQIDDFSAKLSWHHYI